MQLKDMLVKIINLIPIVLPILILAGLFIYILIIQCAGPGASLYKYFSIVLLPRFDAPLLIG